MARILCDMDDVLNNLTNVWLDALNTKYHGTRGYRIVRIEDIREFDICKYFPTLTVEQVFEPLDNPAIYEKLTPPPGSVRALKKWMDQGHDVRISTATYYLALRPKFVAFQRDFPFFRWEKHVIVVPKEEKQYIRGDIAIDDYHGNLIGGQSKGVLVNRPWNVSFNEQEHGIIRAYNWDDVERDVDKLLSLENISAG